jgi:hypothetical protein
VVPRPQTGEFAGGLVQAATGGIRFLVSDIEDSEAYSPQPKAGDMTLACASIAKQSATDSACLRVSLLGFARL